MASVFYTKAKAQIMDGTINLDTDDLDVLLCMTNTTCDTEEDTTFLDQFTLLDEMDGLNYTGGHGGADRLNLAVTVSQDDTNDRGELIVTGGSTTWTAIGPGTRSVQGALIFKKGASEAASVPIVFVDFSADVDPASPTGDLTINWNAEGAIQLT